MMKFLGWFFGLLISTVIVAYVVVFTPMGNALVKPFIEQQLKKQTKLPTTLDTFTLGLDSFHIVVTLNKNNRIFLEGTYALLEQSFHVDYKIALGALETLQSLTKTQLQDNFLSDGSVEGNLHFITVDGKSDVAKSNTKYHIELTEFNPTSIIAKMQNVNLKALLHMLNQKTYATANVNLNINFKNITPHKLDGKIKLTTFQGKINTKVMKKDFGITVPSTFFSMHLDADMKGDFVNYVYHLDSNLAQISSGGRIIPDPLNVALTYKFNVKELAVLKPLTGIDVRGPLSLDGTLKGTKAQMKLQGKTDIALSKTSFLVNLKNLAPANLLLHVKALHLEKLLYMVKQPHYANALVDVTMNMKNLNPKNLQGTVDTKLYKGLFDSKYLTKAYAFKSPMPRTFFNATTHTKLHKDLTHTKLHFNTTLAILDVKDAEFNVKTANLFSDYKIKLRNLDKLYFITQRHLKGIVIAHGQVAKAKDLDFSMYSSIAQGNMEVKLHNDALHVSMKKLQTLDILDMLLYPKIIKSNIDAKLDYNLASEKGKFQGYITQGYFTKNQVLDLTKHYGKIDLYKQVFHGDVGADIHKENIIASLDLQSNTSSIKTNNTFINTLTQQIDSQIHIKANKHPLVVKLRGDINAPKVSVDASELIKIEAKKALRKNVSNKLKDEIKKNITKEDVKNLLKSLF